MEAARSAALARAPKATKWRREDEILEVAARIFAEHGYATATTQQIAEELGIQKGSLYHYVKRKEDLLFLVAMRMSEHSVAMYDEVRARTDLNAIERLALCINLHVHFAVGHQHALRAWYRNEHRLNPDRRAILAERSEPGTRLVIGLIAEAQAEGLADPTADPEILFKLYIAAVRSICEWYDPETSPSVEVLARTATDFALLGMVGHSPGGSD
jgi:AcrR family transcriptional regulator